MLITPVTAGQVLLRDLAESDRDAFVRYQTDPRYRRLYDFDEDPGRPSELFDRFLGWQRQMPRKNFQLGLYEKRGERLVGCGGLCLTGERAAVLGIEVEARCAGAKGG